MAIDLTLKSVAITNREASPRVLNNPGMGAVGRVHNVSSHIASVTAALSITSIIRMVEVPAHCYVRHVYFQSAAQGAGAFDVGIYRTNADGGAVVDKDLFGSAINCASAVLKTDITSESTEYTIPKQCLQLWEAGGMTTEPPPGTMLDVCAVVTTTDVTTGTGALMVQVEYVL